MGDTITGLDRDAISRSRIVSEIDANFFVEAGAGSGKTTMLVNRMAAMVEAGLDISRISAITFTKAAAGEFYDRFQKLLIKRSSTFYTGGEECGKPGSLPAPTDVTRARCRAALQNIDLCFMGTIDAFCNMILSEHPSEAGIPSDAGIVSDEDAATVYKQQYIRVCRGEYGEDLQILGRTFQSFYKDPQDVFVKGISFIMNNRNMHFNYHEPAAGDIDQILAAERSELIRAVKCLVEHPELKYEENKPSREAWNEIGKTCRTICRRWSTQYTNLQYALKSLQNIRLIPEAMDRYAVSLGPVFIPGGTRRKWLECTIGKAGGLTDRLDKYQYNVSMTFLIRCVPVMEQAMREKGFMTFFDYLYYLRNMLKKDAEQEGKLIRYIYDRHSYFLIDEFQDTNPLQAEVFFYLSAEYPVPQWSDCVPRPGSLFIVGDPKQSIYRFRSADVTSFLKVKKLFEDHAGAILTLSRNFRSTRVLCKYFNSVFKELLPEETVNQSRFEDIPLPEPVNDEFQGIFMYEACDGKAAEAEPEMADQVRIADVIEKLVGSEDCLIRPEPEKDLRPLQYSDFMVITSGKKKLAPIMAEFRKRGIPVRAEGTVPFAETEALCEISRIYSAVADTDDPLALYGALTGKLLSLTKEDILRFRACGGIVSLKAPIGTVPVDREAYPGESSIVDENNGSDKKDSCENRNSEEISALHAMEKISRLKSLSASALRLSPAALFSKIMDDYRVWQYVSAENLEVVYYALELLRNAEKSGQVVTLRDGGTFLRNLIAGASGEERCLSLDVRKDCVHIANLHKVKGLEAPVVILAGASSWAFPAEYRLEHRDDGSEGYLFSLSSGQNEKGKGKTYFQTRDFMNQQTEENDALEAERRRLIYVAATRARNVLILCNRKTITRGKTVYDSKWSPVMKDGLPDIFDFIGDIPVKVREQEPGVDAADLYACADSTSILKDRDAQTSSFMVKNPSRLPLLSKLSDSIDTLTYRSFVAGSDEAEQETELAAEDTVERAPGRTLEESRYAALLGTMTHKLMETLVMTGNKVNIHNAVEEIICEYRTQESEPYEGVITRLLLKAADRIRNGGYAQPNGFPQDILKILLAADEVYCELPFCYSEETDSGIVVWNGVMDVVYAESGHWHIVDYKTNADGTGLDIKYQAQLAAYTRAFRAATGMDADAWIYHIDI